MFTQQFDGPLFNEAGLPHFINTLESYYFILFLYIFLASGALEMESKGRYKMTNCCVFVIYYRNISFTYELAEVTSFYSHAYDKINEAFGLVNLR